MTRTGNYQSLFTDPAEERLRRRHAQPLHTRVIAAGPSRPRARRLGPHQPLS